MERAKKREFKKIKNCLAQVFKSHSKNFELIRPEVAFFPVRQGHTSNNIVALLCQKKKVTLVQEFKVFEENIRPKTNKKIEEIYNIRYSRVQVNLKYLGDSSQYMCNTQPNSLIQDKRLT